MIKKALCIIIAAFMMFALTACGTNTEHDAMTLAFREINKHGNIILDVTFDQMNSHNIEIGDVITVFVGDKEYDMPVGTSYTDVDSGEMICRFDLEDNEVALAINYGSFAAATGAAVKLTTDDEPGYKWDISVQEVRISLKEKKGYLDEYRARNLSRTDAREDYPDLTDEEFANFRAVNVQGLKDNILFRSSTPIEPAIGRNTYAMAEMEKAGIKTVINLDDSAEAMNEYDAFSGSYYSRCAIVNPEMSYDYESEEFAAKVKESVLFIIKNDGPYLIHCKEGKDRTGILCAVIECFAGASADEIARDYMITYYNYYGVKTEDAAYGIILNNNLIKTLRGLFGVDDIKTANLKDAATQYLISVGLNKEQLNDLTVKLLTE